MKVCLKELYRGMGMWRQQGDLEKGSIRGRGLVLRCHSGPDPGSDTASAELGRRGINTGHRVKWNMALTPQHLTGPLGNTGPAGNMDTRDSTDHGAKMNSGGETSSEENTHPGEVGWREGDVMTVSMAAMGDWVLVDGVTDGSVLWGGVEDGGGDTGLQGYPRIRMQRNFLPGMEQYSQGAGEFRTCMQHLFLPGMEQCSQEAGEGLQEVLGEGMTGTGVPCMLAMTKACELASDILLPVFFI